MKYAPGKSLHLRHQHGAPSKVWVITLPGPGYRVDGDIRVKLDRDEPATVKVKYKTKRESLLMPGKWYRRGIKKHLVVLTFSRVADGWAFATICKGKHGWGERPGVTIEH